MKIDEFMMVQEQLFDKLKIVTEQAQKEYAHGANTVFANFERVARYLSLTPPQVLLTYLIKHIDGIAAYTKGVEAQREPIYGRIEDAIVYLTLLYAMLIYYEQMSDLERANLNLPPLNLSKEK